MFTPIYYRGRGIMVQNDILTVNTGKEEKAAIIKTGLWERL